MRGDGGCGMAVALVEGAVQPFAVGRMGDIDQELGALFEVLAEEVDATVFGSHPVDMTAGGHNAGTFLQDGNDPGDTGGGDGGHGDDGQAAFGEGGAMDEVHLAADAGVL